MSQFLNNAYYLGRRLWAVSPATLWEFGLPIDKHLEKSLAPTWASSSSQWCPAWRDRDVVGEAGPGTLPPPGGPGGGPPPSHTLQGVGGAQAHFMSPHFLLLGWHWRASVFPHFTQAKGQFCPLNAGTSNEWLTGPWMIYNAIALTDWRTPPFKNVKKKYFLVQPHLRNECWITRNIQSQVRIGWKEGRGAQKGGPRERGEGGNQQASESWSHLRLCSSETISWLWAGRGSLEKIKEQ